MVSARKTTVLVVEDDKLCRMAIKEELEQAGYEVVETGDFSAAREKFHDVDFALLDYHLPDGTGLHLLEEIRRAELWYPVVIVTSHTTEAGEEEARALGANGYLSKPEWIGKLASVVETVLEGSRSYFSPLWRCQRASS